MRDFAICTGRLSAEVEHSWLVDTETADRNGALYENMEALLLAVVNPDDEVQARAIRIEAKMAHQKLLLQSAFGWEKERRLNAEQRARELVIACSSLTLASGNETMSSIWATGSK